MERVGVGSWQEQQLPFYSLSLALAVRGSCTSSSCQERDWPEKQRASGSHWALPLDGLHSCLSHYGVFFPLPSSLLFAFFFLFFPPPFSEFTSLAGMHIWSLSSLKSSFFFSFAG